MEISFVGVILLDFVTSATARSRFCFHPLSAFLASAVKGEVLQQFGNINGEVQDEIKHLSGIFAHYCCVSFSSFVAVLTSESRKSNRAKHGVT